MTSVILDIETTGLPSNRLYKYKDIKSFESSRIVQLSYIITDFKELYKEYNYIIKRDNFSINNSNLHNITNEISDNKGIEIKNVLNEFIENIEKCDKLYAHNLKFDLTIVKSEMYRIGINFPINIIGICTMKKNYNNKYMKLTELYYETFNKNIEQDHNSLNDCKILYEILLVLGTK